MNKKWLLLWLLASSSLALYAQHGVLQGCIVNEKGMKVPGATVLLEPDRHLKQCNEQGCFTVGNLYEGLYTLYVSSVGFVTDTQQVSIKNGATATVTITLQQGVGTLTDVIVSADATKALPPDNLLNLQRGAMPVTIITREMIGRMGSRRLDEVLKEQTGMAVVSDISGGARATGVQMQGFSSEYVMILIDGQPMVGRNAGNFDLSRISVTNIERIEVIKGASSCLFGSEALGGAINIVTRYGAVQPQAQALVQYGSLHIVDATLEGETPFAHKRASANIAANYYHSDGFNTDKQYLSQGTTSPPYDDYSLQGRVRYRVSKNGTLGATARYALRRSYMQKVYAGLGLNENNSSGDKQNITDVNVSAYYNNQLSSNWQSNTRYYLTHYTSDMSVVWQQGAVASAEKFSQTLHRLEQQLAYQATNQLKFTSGAGGSLEHLSSNAFTNAADMLTAFVFIQSDWQPAVGTSITGGLRYDRHNSYGGRLNPSVALEQKIFTWLQAKVAAGTGFKTPDFKDRYQVFVNPLSNYMVIGTEVLRPTLAQLDAAGALSEVRQFILNQVANNLQPETSTSLNISLKANAGSALKVEAGVFYHHLNNQINSVRVATGTNNQQIFTYQNLPRSVNKGAELSLTCEPVKALEISISYQYLIAKDLSVEDSIRTGHYPWNKIRNNETGETRTATPADYWGLENRSRHMGNLRLFYSLSRLGLYTTFRINYRGKYPYGDANNNGFIDRYDTFVDGYFLLNASIEKRLLKDKLSIRITADNMLNYVDRLMPAQPGRVILGGVTFRL